MIQGLGNHLIIELYECNPKLINNTNYVKSELENAVDISGATKVKTVVHQFNPHGVSGVVVIEESHFSIHTWPEYGYCALDIFTCGSEIDYQKALHYLKEKFQAKQISVNEIKRGILDLPVKIQHKPQAMASTNNE